MFRLLAVTLLFVLPVISHYSCWWESGIDKKVCLLQERVEKLESRLNSGRTCIRKYTTWTGRSDAKIMNLDRHHLDCPSKYSLVSFRFQRAGLSPYSNVRYTYRCCRIPMN
ncbi:hypothetical protein ABFA07_018879 [Porites harrisoni]